MKNLNFKDSIVIALSLVAISFTACKKKEVTPTNTTNTVESDTLSKYNYYYSCTLDGLSSAWASNSTGVDSVKLKGNVDYYHFGSFAFNDIASIINSDTTFVAGHFFTPNMQNISKFVGGLIYNFVPNKKDEFVSKDFLMDTTGMTDLEFYRAEVINSDTIFYNYKPISPTDKVHFNYTKTSKIIGSFSGKVTLYSEYSSKTQQTTEYQSTNPSKMKQVQVEGKFSSQIIKSNNL